MDKNKTSKEINISLKIKSYYKNKSKKKSINDDRIKNHIKNVRLGGINKIYDVICSRINIMFKKYKLKLDMSYTDLIGCTLDELEVYLINKFKPGMTIDNHGEWHVDHIYPISKFDFTNKDNIFKCFHHTNLQPLWKLENLQKGNKVL